MKLIGIYGARISASQYFIPQIVDRESVPGLPKERVILRLRSESDIAWNERLTRFIPVRKNISESRIP